MLKKTEKIVMHSYPGMVAIVTAKLGSERNVMAAGWHSYISYEPAIYGVAIAEERFTHRLVKGSGEFVINFLPAEMAEVIQFSGTESGSAVDKFQELNLKTLEAETVGAPVLKDAYVAYECKVMDFNRYGDHDWIVGKISMFHKDMDRFQGNGLPDWDKLHIPLYLGRSQYLIADNNSRIVTHRIENQ
ncbi:flavin reductase family protein [Pseudalkalibacillus caeni]|uniref:Flavin reductase family protein n=1 Tax=Exobacillus caeni TaxID=2574798 RepID=A0A5R9F1N8_9BACL|nr:flavin reductase family protein [Pseudalkalibacillus caeni]TLS37487.1 flavin reductase family protein [Pseudalkalibacillus caeni]